MSGMTVPPFAVQGPRGLTFEVGSMATVDPGRRNGAAALMVDLSIRRALETEPCSTGRRRLVDPVPLTLGDDEQRNGVDGGGAGNAVGMDLAALHP